MWHAIALWSAGLLYGFPPYAAIDTQPMRKNAITRITTINLKKVSGGAAADMSTVNAYAHQDRDLLLEQIDEINPHCIVACGVFDILVWLLDLEPEPDSTYEKSVLDKKRNVVVIPFRHPGKINNYKTYLKLKELVSGVCLKPGLISDTKT